MIALFRKINKTWTRVIVGLLTIVSFSAVFPAGMLNTDSQIEICAEFFSTLTSKHTKGKTYSAMVVEPKDGSTQPLNDTTKEFYELYGSFRTDKACFANTVNVNKDKNIKLDHTDIDNLSLLYTTSGLLLKYVENVGWRHEFYPINMMFDAPKSERPAPPVRYCFISQTQADALLKSDFLGEPIPEPFGIEDYKKLQYKLINLSCEDSIVSYYILSIYLETGYYYQALKEIMGDFVFAFGGTPSNLKRQAVYFMRDYSFQNQHYINYARKKYDASNFNYQIGTYNLIDDFAKKEDITALIFPNFGNGFSITLFVLSSVTLLVDLLFIFLSEFGKCWYDAVIFSGAAFVPYLIFKLVSISTESTKLFTSLSSQFNMVMLIVALCVFAVLFLLKNVKKKEVKQVE